MSNRIVSQNIPRKIKNKPTTICTTIIIFSSQEPVPIAIVSAKVTDYWQSSKNRENESYIRARVHAPHTSSNITSAAKR